MADFDVIIVGSGFGGGAVACRLAEAGAKVLVLERGQRWTPQTFPRKPTDAWLYDNARASAHHGWFDVRLFKGMTVVQGAGVGGGSLSYANVTLRADAERFAAGWPDAITADALAPYYERAETMLGVNRIPEGQMTARARILERAAAAYHLSDRFHRVPLGVSFDPDFSHDQPGAVDPKRSKSFVNAHGARQGTCVHLANCQVGCDVLAKNTVDLTYLAKAESLGVDVLPMHLVRAIEPEGSGYLIRWDRIVSDGDTPGSASADRVVLAAGSLGTTELLLRCRDEAKTLPNVSAALGRRWSPNANFLTPAQYPDKVTVDQSVGPHITAGLDLMDGHLGGQRLYIEDDGFPNVVLNALRGVAGALGLEADSPIAAALKPLLEAGEDTLNPFRQTMMWLGTGVDAGDGRLQLDGGDLKLDWDVHKSRAVMDAIVTTHKRLSEVEYGVAETPIWDMLKWLVTVHPLGGCAMADRPEKGVVDHKGEVFGHPNLFVIDGAAIPTPIGRNPALTIAALAERGADLMTAAA